MSQEHDKRLYVDLFNILYDPCGCHDDGWTGFYRTAIKEIEGRYDEDTLRRWIEEGD